MKRSRFRIVCVFFLAAALLSVTGCAGYMEYLHRSPWPNFRATQTLTRYESTNYEVLGIVRAEGYSRCIVGVVIQGTEGEALLWDEAINKFGNRVTGIKDINVSYDYMGIIPPIYSVIYTSYVGTAVHEK